MAGNILRTKLKGNPDDEGADNIKPVVARKKKKPIIRKGSIKDLEKGIMT